MTEVVINACYGGFSLSHRAVMAYADRKGMALHPEASDISVRVYGEPVDLDTYRGSIGYYKVPPEQYQALADEIRASGENYQRLNDKDWYFSEGDIARDDPDLVAVVREFGGRANGTYAKLRIVEIPDEVEWVVEEYDGYEHVAAKHRMWA